jgi:hypothetical protein
MQPLNKHNFEIKKKVWSVDTSEHYSSSSHETNGIDVSERISFVWNFNKE